MRGPPGVWRRWLAHCNSMHEDCSAAWGLETDKHARVAPPTPLPRYWQGAGPDRARRLPQARTSSVAGASFSFFTATKAPVFLSWHFHTCTHMFTPRGQLEGGNIPQSEAAVCLDAAACGMLLTDSPIHRRPPPHVAGTHISASVKHSDRPLRQVCASAREHQKQGPSMRRGR